MPDLPPEVSALFDQLAAKVLVTLRHHYPTEADALFVTFISRCFLDICRDNRGPQLDMLVSLFNSHVDAPVLMTRCVQ